MQVQINADKHISGALGLQERVEQVLAQELKHLAERVTRVEVHLNDESSSKSGAADKRCQLEARMKGLDPVSVEHRAPDVYLALSGAARQLARALGTLQGKREAAARGRESIRRIDLGSAEAESGGQE